MSRRIASHACIHRRWSASLVEPANAPSRPRFEVPKPRLSYRAWLPAWLPRCRYACIMIIAPPTSQPAASALLCRSACRLAG
jgi:hypothetical protein